MDGWMSKWLNKWMKSWVSHGWMRPPSLYSLHRKTMPTTYSLAIWMTQFPYPTMLRIPHPHELATTSALPKSLVSQHTIDLLDHGVCICIRLGVFSTLLTIYFSPSTHRHSTHSGPSPLHTSGKKPHEPTKANHKRVLWIIQQTAPGIQAPFTGIMCLLAETQRKHRKWETTRSLYMKIKIAWW